jgi:ubiquinone/menaquinone biosynthesis C-methylase UbiE
MAKFKDQYSNLAKLYDSEIDRNAQKLYGEWRTSLLKAIRQHRVKVKTLVDLACGTGNTTIPWTRQRGWTIIGVDYSAAMLKEARKKSKRVQWHRQDLKNLILEGQADVVTCHFDALDHFLIPRDLQKVFFNVAELLNEGGLFQFDMNTEHWFRWLSAHEKLFQIGHNCFTASNEYDPKRRIGTFRQIWFVKKGKMYEKREVKIKERAYSTDEIRSMIKKAGLHPMEVKVQRKLEGKPIRILYLVRKPKKSR